MCFPVTAPLHFTHRNGSVPPFNVTTASPLCQASAPAVASGAPSRTRWKKTGLHVAQTQEFAKETISDSGNMDPHSAHAAREPWATDGASGGGGGAGGVGTEDGVALIEPNGCQFANPSRQTSV